MLHTVTLPAITVTLETKDGILPEGTMIQLSVPVRALAVKSVTPPVAPPVTLSTSDSGESEIEGSQTETPEPIEDLPSSVFGLPSPTLDRSYPEIEFRAAARRFDLLGNAMTLGLSDADWTMVLNVRFVNFDTEQRIIGSATRAGAGSSLQIGTLKGGFLWVDTFLGGLSVPDPLELNRWYEIAVSHHTSGEEKIYLDKKLILHGGVPTFHSDADLYVGRWLDNSYADFDGQSYRCGYK